MTSRQIRYFRSVVAIIAITLPLPLAMVAMFITDIHLLHTHQQAMAEHNAIKHHHAVEIIP